MPTRLTGCGARARAYSVLKMATCTGGAPRPPYSWGQWMPTQRPSASRACHRRPHSTSSSRSANAGGGSRLAASHSRTSSANASSSELKLRSTGSEVPEALAAGGDEAVVQLALVTRTEGVVGVLAPAADVERVTTRAVGAELLVHELTLDDLVGRCR